MIGELSRKAMIRCKPCGKKAQNQGSNPCSPIFWSFFASIKYQDASFKYMAETVTISRKEYERLKKLEKVDHELISQLVDSLEDAKQGRIRRVA